MSTKSPKKVRKDIASDLLCVFGGSTIKTPTSIPGAGKVGGEEVATKSTKNTKIEKRDGCRADARRGGKRIGLLAFFVFFVFLVAQLDGRRLRRRRSDRLQKIIGAIRAPNAPNRVSLPSEVSP